MSEPPLYPAGGSPLPELESWARASRGSSSERKRVRLMLSQVLWYRRWSVTPADEGEVVRWSREGCEINSIRTGHHQQVRQDTRLYTRAPRWQMLFPATSPNTPLGGESCWRLTWYDFPSTKVVAGNFFMPAANYRGVGVEMPMS